MEAEHGIGPPTKDTKDGHHGRPAEQVKPAGMGLPPVLSQQSQKADMASAGDPGFRQSHPHGNAAWLLSGAR
jgi:hypothetical protein